MKNYLKKAISAVIALALAASFVPATLAANVALTDVPETADYATAVNTLVALGVVNGYEDNTFKPDNNITRAEASKIIVAALNETAAAEAMKGATKFSDIEAKHEWATGYINKGVSMGYINGMENNQFQPDGNVTFAQVVKMMLCAMGYEDYAASLAEQYGYTGANWYIPYTQLAADAGVTEGVYAGPNEAVTRAQVAQLVFNAIKAPIVKNVGITYTDSGKIVPKIQIQDGVETSVYYRSILTEKFDAYYVEGYVTETNKDGAGLKADEVKFAIAKSKWYVEEDVRFDTTINSYATLTDGTNNDRILQKVYVGDTAAADYKATYATAIIMLDDYDDWTILDFTPSGKNKTYTFDLKDIDDEAYEDASGALVQANWTGANSYLKFFADGASTSTKYTLDALSNVTVYVNGVAIAANDATVDPIWNYVIKGDIGDVELVDTYKTDGKIDAIYVNSYVSGMVAGVNSTGKITLSAADAGISTLTLDEEDTTKEFHIYYNGEEITVNDLQKDDVITVAYKVDTTNAPSTSVIKNAVAASNFYEVYVSRDVVTDTLKGKNDDDYEAKFGDTYYPFVSSAKYTSFDGASKLGDEYTLYLDAFGRVFKAEINSSAANWGIAEKFTLASSDDDYKLTVFTADGTTKAYYFDASKATVNTGSGDKNKTTEGSENALNALVKDAVYVTAAEEAADAVANGGTATITEGDKEEINARVIQYKVSSSSGMITELKFIADSVNTITTPVTAEKEEFKARNNTIGSIKLGDATKVIDATKYAADDDLFATTVAGLTDEVEYKAYGYGTKIDGVYPFVLVVEGEAAYNSKTRFAVITKEGYAEETDAETGDIVYSIAALYGDAEELIVSDDVSTSTLATLKVGDVIYFKTNAKGQVTEFDVIFSTGNGVPTHDYLASASLKNANTTYANLTYTDNMGTAGDTSDDVTTTISIPGTTNSGNFSSDFTTSWTGGTSDSIRYVYGPIVKVTENDIEFAKISANKTNTVGRESDADGVVVYGFDKDVNVYTYDYFMGKDLRFAYNANAVSAIQPSNIDAYLTANSTDVVDWTNADVKAGANFAFAIVHDDEIVDIFAFLAK